MKPVEEQTCPTGVAATLGGKLATLPAEKFSFPAMQEIAKNASLVYREAFEKANANTKEGGKARGK